MQIDIHRIGRFREVGFQDAENRERWVHSGLMNADEAMEFASRLREVADELTTWAITDESEQTLLPFAADARVAAVA